MLYMPGSNARALEKAKSIAADSLILDLEDAVAPNAKGEARELVAKALAERAFGKREVTVRINALDSPWGKDDLQVVAPLGPDAILIPKVESAAAVHDLELGLAAFGAPSNTAIGAMIETPLGVLRAQEIAASTSRLTLLVMGTSDLTTDLRARHTRDRQPLLTSLQLCVLAARAHGVAIVDGVALDLADDEGFELACVQGKNMGFDGKTLIHPKTVAMANKVFGPDAAAVEHAHRVIAAYEEAAASGKGVATLDGKLVENLHAAEARRLVTFASAIADLSAAT